MEQIKQRRLGEQEWRQIMERQGQSGLTISEFCQQENINLGSLYRWRSRLRRRRPAQPTPKSPGGSKCPATIADPGFVEVGSLSESTQSSRRFEIRLELGEGLALYLVRG